MNNTAQLLASLQLSDNVQQTTPLIMGVLNVTPDSFSDGGAYTSGEHAYSAAMRMTDQGAAIIDIGGESTGPGAKAVSAEEELARITPLLQTLPDQTCVSLDTYKAAVARRGIELGVRIINDVSALRADAEMADVIAAGGCHTVLMYSKEEPAHPHASFSKRSYENIVAEIAEFLLERAQCALAAGIAEDRIILDPGMGEFISRDAADSWELLAQFEELCAAVSPYPILIGTSRKGFLGVPLPERDPLSAMTSAVAAARGAAIVRVHNVRMTMQMLQGVAALNLR